MTRRAPDPSPVTTTTAVMMMVVMTSCCGGGAAPTTKLVPVEVASRRRSCRGRTIVTRRAPAPAPVKSKATTKSRLAPPAPAPIKATTMKSRLAVAPVPTPVKPTVKSRARAAPAPIKTVRNMMWYCHDPPTEPKPEPAPEVADTGLWSPPSISSSDEEAASPTSSHQLRVVRQMPRAAVAARQLSQGGVVPPAEEEEKTAATSPASSSHQLRVVPYYNPVRQQMPRVVGVRQVWDGNLAEEVALIESLLPRFRYVAVDTEFPGTVHRPAGPAYLLTPEERYALLKKNVDELDVIQLGLTLFDDDDRAAAVWEFNFREFDIRRHRHAPESIALLRAKGVDFDRTTREGVRATAFGPRLRKWLRAAGLGRAGVVTFSGGYDLAYLLKVMFGSGFTLPATAPELESVVKALFRRRNLFDVREMARRCPGDFRGGLETVARKLDVARVVGEAHQAGSDSLLTCHTFTKMKERFFDGDDDKLTRVAGMLTDITAF